MPDNPHGQPIGEPVDWSPRPRPRRVALTGRWVELQPVSTAHAPALFDAVAGPGTASLWTYRTDEPPADPEELARRLEALADSTETVTFAVVPEGGCARGLMTLMRIDSAQGSAEVGGVLYGPGLQRTRAATEAVHLLARHLFEDLGYRRLEWKCDSLNEPSRRAATRLGFTYEGRFRNAVVYKGRNRDTDWFSITDVEWRTLRSSYAAWLDPSNFDRDGRQRRPLRHP